ncbi:hypothetical protein ACFP63_08260 [Oerskovia jenensis]|uniref:DUF3352 domain-containing protein n=1 Tax=Oerskovia jenensis TaxID=162169 RepID=A0ABS2LJH7_9CELL|nr:hypothetical protein [Oerskovia jenensis]MBM7480044.1 hypothetical protein [Oerskovia jenensis]
MTTPPTFPPADPSGTWQSPDGAAPLPGAVTTVRPSRLRTGLVLGGAATAALVLVGGGVFAYSALDGGGAQPEEALPGTAFAYVRVDLDPSATQKVNLLRLANRFPDLATDLDVDLGDDADLRRLVVDAISTSGTCEIDYATDVEPWIGHRAAFAALPAAEGATTEGAAATPEPVIALQVTDEGAARAAIESGLGCGDGVKPAQVAFADGYALITSEQVVAADVAAAAKKSPLAEAPRFVADMKALGDPGLISYWADLDGVATALDGQDGAEALSTATDGLHSFAGAARAGADHLEVAIAVGADEKVLAPLDGAGGSLLPGLPESTLFASSATIDPASVDRLWEQLSTLADTFGSSGLGALGSGEDLLGDDWSLSSHEVRTAGTLPAATEAECAALLALPENALDASGWGFSPEELAEVTQSYNESFMAGCTGDYSALDQDLDVGQGAEDTGLLGDDGLSSGSTTDDLLPSGLTFQETVDELKKTYDLRLPEDLKTLLGEQVVVALDSAGLDDVSAVTGLADLDLGARTLGDKAALEDLLGRIDAVLVDAGAEKLTSAPTKDGLVIASNDAYAARLAEEGGLGTVGAFRTVVPDARNAANAAYLDVDALESIARANIDALGGDDSWIAYVAPVRAVGVATRVDGGHSLTSLRVSFD